MNVKLLSISDLEALSTEVHAELKRRYTIKAASMPAPELTGNKPADVMAYRNRHGCSVQQASLCVERAQLLKGGK